MVARCKQWFSSTLSDLDCSFKQSFARELHARRNPNSMIENVGHVSGTIWISILRFCPFPPFSVPFPPLSVLCVFCLCWFLLFVMMYFVVFSIHTSIAFWKHASNAVAKSSSKRALILWSIKVSQTCRNTIPPVLGDVALLTFGISFEIKKQT